jgi:hypothetical protein
MQLLKLKAINNALKIKIIYIFEIIQYFISVLKKKRNGRHLVE